MRPNLLIAALIAALALGGCSSAGPDLRARGASSIKAAADSLAVGLRGMRESTLSAMSERLAVGDFGNQTVPLLKVDREPTASSLAGSQLIFELSTRLETTVARTQVVIVARVERGGGDSIQRGTFYSCGEYVRDARGTVSASSSPCPQMVSRVTGLHAMYLAWPAQLNQ